MKMKEKKLPSLRFPEFNGSWKEERISQLIEKVSIPIEVEESATYTEIGIRSHGKGVFHKEPVTGKDIGQKRVFSVVPNTFALNIVFAWEQAVAVLTEQEAGCIASHRFPMYREREAKSCINFLKFFFLRPRGKFLLELASPGGAGRNKTLGQNDFHDLKLIVPEQNEQREIASFLEAVDRKTELLGEKINLLRDYKTGVVQSLANQSLRFRDSQGNQFPAWEHKLLRSILAETKNKSDGSEPVYSVSVHKGLVDQVEHLGRSYSASDTGHYNRVNPGDIVYTKSPTGSFPFGIVKQSKIAKSVIVSPLYGVFKPETSWLGSWLDAYFESSVRTGNYLRPIVQKGAKNTINITNSTFLSDRLLVPVHHEEQQQIAEFLGAIDAKIGLIAQELELAQTFKKGLLQQMFV